MLALHANPFYNRQRFRSVFSAVQSGQSLCELGVTISHQLRWQADGGPTSCAGWIKTRIRLCSLAIVFVSKSVFKQATIGPPAKRHLNAV